MTDKAIPFQRVQYNREIHFDGRVILMSVFSDPDAKITIQSMQQGHGSTGIAVPGGQGADLIVAMSTVFASALSGVDATAKVGVSRFSSIRMEGEWHVQFSNNATAFVVDLPMMRHVLDGVNVLLNDATGEYRRQLAQMTADMAIAQHNKRDVVPEVEEPAPAPEIQTPLYPDVEMPGDGNYPPDAINHPDEDEADETTRAYAKRDRKG